MIPRQKRAQPSAASARSTWASPTSSTGSRSGRGSSPTISWERLRSTASARRSAKSEVARAGSALTSQRLARDSAFQKRRGPLARPSKSSQEAGLVTAAAAHSAAAAALDSLFQLAAGGELWHGARGDRHFLARVAWIDALPLLAVLGRELPETGEVDLAAALEDVGDRLEE